MVIVISNCKECGKKFEINDSEKEFFVSKNLALPKRCKECRKKRKENKQKEENKNNG